MSLEEAVKDAWNKTIARQASQIARLRAENARLCAALVECEAELVEHADLAETKDGQPIPNWAMRLLANVRLVLGS